MEKLFVQVLKFGLAGGITTAADFGIFGLLNVFGCHYIIANICSYLSAMIINYWINMNFVFVRKDHWSRKKEFVVFAVLSMIGLFVNTFCLWFFYDVIYKNIVGINDVSIKSVEKLICKIGAAVILMVYNFVSRKLILEKKG